MDEKNGHVGKSKSLHNDLTNCLVITIYWC